MSRQIQIRRGTNAEHANFIGAVGEITMDTTEKTLRVHDGQTPGGVPLARADAHVSPKAILDCMMLDFDNAIDYTDQDKITIPANGFMMCRGSMRSLDLVKSDFATTILAEYMLSNNYTTTWVPVFSGQCFKNREISEYQCLIFFPFVGSTRAADSAARRV